MLSLPLIAYCPYPASSCVANSTGIVVTVTVVFQGEFQTTAPLLVFAVLSVLGGGATLLLPETAGVVLPQTLAQAEVFSQQATPLCCRYVCVCLPGCSVPGRY